MVMAFKVGGSRAAGFRQDELRVMQRRLILISD